MSRFGSAAMAGAVAIVTVAGFLGFPAALWAAETRGPVTDEIGVIKIAKGAPISIGAYFVLSGADTALGIDTQRGVEIALKDHDNTIAGHPVRLVTEDDMCSAEGGQTAATKLAANPNIAVVVGPSCSSAATAGAPILWRAGIASIGTSSSAPSLTAPDRKPEYGGFLRVIINDNALGAGTADWLYNIKGARSVVTVHDGSPYAQQLTAVMAKRFQELGGKVLSEEAVAPTDVDMHPVLTHIATVKPDAVYMPIYLAAAVQMVRQSKNISGLEKTAFIGGGATLAPAFIEAAGKAGVGFISAAINYSVEALGKSYPKMLAEYKEAYGEDPLTGFQVNGYDAGVAAILAIEKVGKTDEDGNLYIGRKALRDALFQSSFDGVSGPIKCGEHGDCQDLKLAVYEFVGDDPSTYKLGENPKTIFP